MNKYHYLVFINEDVIRDAQAFTSKAIHEDTDIWDTDQEDGWNDISGPILILERDNITRIELQKQLHNLYPDADASIFIIQEYPAQTPNKTFRLSEIENRKV